MKMWTHMAAVAGLAWAAGGCASPGAYFKDRGRDAMDMATLGVEGVGIGAFAHVGPVMSGLGMVGRGGGMGLRGGGWWGHYDCMEVQFVVMGAKGLHLDDWSRYGPRRTEMPATPDRGKAYEAIQILTFPMNLEKGDNVGVNVYGNVEVGAFFGPGVRVGVNALEILDFALGWFWIDIMGDDVTRHTPPTRASGRKPAARVRAPACPPVTPPVTSPDPPTSETPADPS